MAYFLYFLTFLALFSAALFITAAISGGFLDRLTLTSNKAPRPPLRGEVISIVSDGGSFPAVIEEIAYDDDLLCEKIILRKLR